MNSKSYKCCAVPQCGNTSTKTPDKLFVHVPHNKTRRRKWLKLARRDPTANVSPLSQIYFCEDHFDLPNDMVNYMQYHVMGSVSQVRMKPGCVPTKFECQPDRRKRTYNTTTRPYMLKKQRKSLIEECLNDSQESSITTKHSELAETSSGSSGSHGNQQNITQEDQTADELIEVTHEFRKSPNHFECTWFVKSDDESTCSVPETLNEQALEITLALIRRNPQLYIGIPKNCYHLIDIIHEKTEIPTAHILLCLKKVKLDTHFEELADQFGITADKASDIFTANIQILANILQSFIDSQDFQTIPHRQETFVIDSLEINVEPPDESRELTQMERGNTVKYVICCTPDGFINYVSPGYGGRQSDEGLLEDTNYLDRLKSGASVIVNGLANVESMLLQKGLKFIKPRAREKDTASWSATRIPTPDENQLSDEHVQKLIQRIREFTMVKDRSILSSELVRVLDEAVLIACALINLQSFVIN